LLLICLETLPFSAFLAGERCWKYLNLVPSRGETTHHTHLGPVTGSQSCFSFPVDWDVVRERERERVCGGDRARAFRGRRAAKRRVSRPFIFGATRRACASVIPRAPRVGPRV
jgi:hypothetical protein